MTEVCANLLPPDAVFSEAVQGQRKRCSPAPGGFLGSSSRGVLSGGNTSAAFIEGYFSVRVENIKAAAS